jgi:microcystin-dependent protein
MGRIHFYHTVWRTHPTTGVVEPLAGVESLVHEIVNDVEGTDAATVFANRLGVTIGNMVTNSQGVVSYWLDPADYLVHFSDPALPGRIAPFTVGASAVSGDTEGILLGQLPELVQASVFSPGDLKCVAYDAPDIGWLLCDGSPLSRLEYAKLFAKIGTTFNSSGEASTQFRLPDLRGRVPVGADLAAGRLSALDVLGNSGGEQKHVLAAAEAAIRNHIHPGTTAQANVSLSHSHNGTTAFEDHTLAHTHNMPAPVPGRGSDGQPWNDTYVAIAGGDIISSVPVNFAGTSIFDVTATSPGGAPGHVHAFTTAPGAGSADHSHTFNTNNPSGGEVPGDAHENMPPYQILNWMIKT